MNKPKRSVPLCLFVSVLLFSACKKGDHIDPLPTPPPAESGPQLLVKKYATLSGLSSNQQEIVKKAIDSIDAAGFYNKIYSFHIPAFSVGSRSYNILAPVDYDGAFTLTVSSGTPVFDSSGVTLHGTTDKLNTHVVNDLGSNAPNLGVFWYTSVGVDQPIITSGTTPFSIQPRYNGKAYVNIWNSSTGIDVPPTPAGFCGGQRSDNNTVSFFQGNTKYSGALGINSPFPLGGEIQVQGGATDFTLKALVVTEALTDTEESTLNRIIDNLITDLQL